MRSCVPILCMCAVWTHGFLPALADDEPSFLLRSARLKRERLRVGLLGQDHLTIQGKRVAVAFDVREYECALIRALDGELHEMARKRYCYHIHSTNPEDSQYSWTLWSWSTLARFSVWRSGNSTYLAWVDVNDIYFADISKGNDLVDALSDHLRGDVSRIMHVPVWHLMGEKPLVGGLPGPTVEVLGIRSGDGGKMSVRASFPGIKESATFEFDGKEWRRP